MKYHGYLQSKYPDGGRVSLASRKTPNGAMYTTLTAYAKATLAEGSPYTTSDWYLRIDRDGKLAYEFSVEEGDWVEA